MSTHTLTAKQHELVAKWNAIHQGAEAALDWIEKVRDSAATVDAEADSLNIDLYRALNLARSFQHAATTPMALGFFGLSQAGKSYLISSLAADEQGQLETEIGEKQTLNFIQHFNPTGEGAEATGLVTRFTCQEQAIKDHSYPLQLRLFREIDLAMIMVNTWFNDFDQEHVKPVNEDEIKATLSHYESLNMQQVQQQAVSAADVVAFLDYVNSISENVFKKLGAYYQPRLIKIIPYLTLEQRADVFSVLWGKQQLLSNTYIKLGKALATLGGAQTVYAPISAVVEDKDGTRYKQSKDFNIMNVNTLSLLSTAQDQPITVRPLGDGQLQNAVTVSTAELTALTTEMIFPLASTPQNEIVKKIDLLDFPGYRTREQLRKIDYHDEAGVAVDNSRLNVQLFLRGKVAYLFERYTTSQEMSALVMCTTSDMQSEVNSVGGVLSTWVANTQGKTPQERDNRCGLFWAITKMDITFDATLRGADDNIPASCEGLMKKTILERFGNLSWMQQWDTRGSFNNTFLVRKPRIENSFIDVDVCGDEVQIRSDKAKKLELFREEFVRTDTVIQHVAEPGEAFDAVLKLNDGGIGRFSAHLDSIADISFKLTRIDEKSQQWQKKLMGKLQHWQLKEGSGALEEKNAVMQRVGGYLQANLSSISELLYYMQVPNEILRNICASGVYNVESQLEAEEETLEAPQLKVAGVGAPVATPVVARNTHTSEYAFAKAAISAWITGLKDFAERKELLAVLSTSRYTLTPAIVTEWVNEIISASYRYKLHDKITDALLVYQGSMGNRHELAVDKTVLTVQLILQDFIAWFGHLCLPVEQRAERTIGQNTSGHVFDFYTQGEFEDLPTLPELLVSEDKHVEQELEDWLSASMQAILENAGGHDENAISLEQNSDLAVVLDKFEA